MCPCALISGPFWITLGPAVNKTLKDINDNMWETMKRMVPEIISYLAQLYQQSAPYPLSLPSSSPPVPSELFSDPVLLDICSPTVKHKSPTLLSSHLPQAKWPHLGPSPNTWFNAMFNALTDASDAMSTNQGLETQHQHTVRLLPLLQPHNTYCDLQQAIASQYGFLHTDLHERLEALWDPCSQDEDLKLVWHVLFSHLYWILCFCFYFKPLSPP